MTSVTVEDVDPAGRQALGYTAEMQAGSGRVPSLDGLRAVSILLVLFSHFVSAAIFPGGLGVLVFFVISGFLISRLMFAEWKATAGMAVGRFYWRRLWRLYPAVVTYSIVAIASCLLAGRHFRPIEPLSALLYFTNYLWVSYELARVHASMPFSIFWSLSVEEHFYWVFPLVFLALKANPSRLKAAMIVLCLTCLLARFAIAAARPELLTTHLIYWTELRLDSIGFGVLLAALCETESGRRFLSLLSKPQYFSLSLLALALSLAWRDIWFRETIRYSVEAAAVAVLICGILFSRRYSLLQKALNSSVMVWIGTLSYSLYVWHPIVENSVGRVISQNSRLERFLVEMTASFVVATASYYLIEAPLRAHFAKKDPWSRTRRSEGYQH